MYHCLNISFITMHRGQKDIDVQQSQHRNNGKGRKVACSNAWPVKLIDTDYGSRNIERDTVGYHCYSAEYWQEYEGFK